MLCVQCSWLADLYVQSSWLADLYAVQPADWLTSMQCSYCAHTHSPLKLDVNSCFYIFSWDYISFDYSVPSWFAAVGKVLSVLLSLWVSDWVAMTVFVICMRPQWGETGRWRHGVVGLSICSSMYPVSIRSSVRRDSQVKARCCRIVHSFVHVSCVHSFFCKARLTGEGTVLSDCPFVRPCILCPFVLL